MQVGLQLEHDSRGRCLPNLTTFNNDRVLFTVTTLDGSHHGNPLMTSYDHGLLVLPV